MANEKNDIIKITEQLSPSARFTNNVVKLYGNTAGTVQLNEHQKQLVQGYFVAIDRALAAAEEERLRKNASNKDPRYNNDIPVSWQNVNMEQLALDAVYYSRMGLDMMTENHLFPIPYKNNKRGKYDVVLMLGYNGIQYIAEKYALDKPTAVTVELVYSTDTFVPIKKTAGNKVEGYEFVINKPFDRGEIIGGFGYIEYADPAKNKLVIMTKAAIEKRKPKYASPNFWGGKAKVWENGKQVEQQTDGWYEEMCLKTVKREVYSAKYIPRDPSKVDDSYRHLKMSEALNAEIEAEAEIAERGNSVVIDTPDTPSALPKPTQPDENPAPAQAANEEPAADDYPFASDDNPAF